MANEVKPLLEWDKSGEKFYETGVEKGVLFIQAANGTYPKGVAWNGLTKVTEKPTGAESTSLYANDAKYVNLISNEEFEASLEAYTYPDEFGLCDGSKEVAEGVIVGQQKRKSFGLTYKTLLGNDIDATDYGYKLHFIYGATCSPSERGYSTINDSPEAITFSWEMKTSPVKITNGKPTACLTIDSTKANANALKKLEEIIYGTAASEGQPAVEARMPLPDEIIAIMNEGTYDIVYDANGGEGDVPASQVKHKGVDIVLADGSSLTKEGYTFKGWNTDPVGLGEHYDSGALYTKDESCVLYAEWEIIKTTFEISYDINGGEGELPLPQIKNRGEDIVLASGDGIAKEGFDFYGWNTAADGSGEHYNPSSAYSKDEDCLLYAEWGPMRTSFEISYDINGGEGDTPETQTKDRGVDLTLSDGEGITKEGSSLTGWNTTPDGTGEHYDLGGTYSKEADCLLYAEWGVVYTIDYDRNGGEGTLPRDQHKRAGETITLKTGVDLYKEGYTLAKWNTAADGSGDDYNLGGEYSADASATMYAQWVEGKTSFEISYDINGGEGDTPETQTKAKGVDITLSNGAGITKEGYGLAGWNTEPDGSGDHYDLASDYSKDEDCKLYAEWAVSYTISYDRNGGEGTLPADQHKLAGKTIELKTGRDLTKTGCYLAKWNTAADGSGDDYDLGGEYSADESVVLYAQWADSFKIDYDRNGGEGTLPKDQYKAPGETIVLKTGVDLTKEGYTLSKWNTAADGSGDDYDLGGDYSADASATMYAQWTAAANVRNINNLRSKRKK